MLNVVLIAPSDPCFCLVPARACSTISGQSIYLRAEPGGRWPTRRTSRCRASATARSPWAAASSSSAEGTSKQVGNVYDDYSHWMLTYPVHRDLFCYRASCGSGPRYRRADAPRLVLYIEKPRCGKSQKYVEVVLRLSTHLRGETVRHSRRSTISIGCGKRRSNQPLPTARCARYSWT